MPISIAIAGLQGSAFLYARSSAQFNPPDAISYRPWQFALAVASCAP